MEGRLTALVNPAPLSQMEQCGRIIPELVAGMPRIGWPPSSGIGGRIGPEYAYTQLPRVKHSFYYESLPAFRDLPTVEARLFMIVGIDTFYAFGTR
jgi:hypothetical protein